MYTEINKSTTLLCMFVYLILFQNKFFVRGSYTMYWYIHMKYVSLSFRIFSNARWTCAFLLNVISLLNRCSVRAHLTSHHHRSTHITYSSTNVFDFSFFFVRKENKNKKKSKEEKTIFVPSESMEPFVSDRQKQHELSIAIYVALHSLE